MTDAPDTAFALAFSRAEHRKAEDEAAALAREEREAAALASLEDLVYDPRPYPEAVPTDFGLYEGTEIGALYGLPGCGGVVVELGSWRLGKEPR